MPTVAKTTPVRDAAKKVAGFYRACALLVFNTLVLFVVLNVILYFLYRWKDSSSVSNPIYNQYGEQVVKQAYPGWKKEDLDLLLHETWSRTFQFEPFTHFKEGTYAGKWVNVDRNGFRRTKNQGPWPPDADNLNIFLFGGSTTFGFGVADDETIASYLQESLQDQLGKEVRVYNFGRGWYYSSLERTLFEKLLLAGRVPGVAVFIDGINETSSIEVMESGVVHDTPHGSQYLEGAMNNRARSALATLLTELPLTRAARSAATRLGASTEAPGAGGTKDPDQQAVAKKKEMDRREKVIPSIIERHARNKKLIEAAARAYRVSPVFVWQPAPTYNYDTNYHLYKETALDTYSSYKVLYPAMAERVKERPSDYADNFLWLADVQADAKESLYVDAVHYTAKFNSELAATIGRLLQERNLLSPERR